MEEFSNDHERNKEIIRQVDELLTLKASKHDLAQLGREIQDGYVKVKKFSGVENDLKNEL